MFLMDEMKRAVIVEIFFNFSKKEQDMMMQNLYNQGYSAKDISKFFGIGVQGVCNRITAHRELQDYYSEHGITSLSMFFDAFFVQP